MGFPSALWCLSLTLENTHPTSTLKPFTTKGVHFKYEKGGLLVSTGLRALVRPCFSIVT